MPVSLKNRLTKSSVPPLWLPQTLESLSRKWPLPNPAWVLSKIKWLKTTSLLNTFTTLTKMKKPVVCCLKTTLSVPLPLRNRLVSSAVSFQPLTQLLLRSSNHWSAWRPVTPSSSLRIRVQKMQLTKQLISFCKQQSLLAHRKIWLAGSINLPLNCLMHWCTTRTSTWSLRPVVQAWLKRHTAPVNRLSA